MATNMRRFTISITPRMEKYLDQTKKEKYYNKTQTQMIRDLITIGLENMNVSSESLIENSNNEFNE